MGDNTSDTMNLDLNLSPGPEGGPGSIASELVHLDDWDGQRIRRITEEVRLRGMRDDVRFRGRHRWRWRHVQVPHETQNISMELNPLIVNSGNGSTLQAGEGSVTAEERTTEVPKLCENNNGFLEADASEKTDDVEKGSGIDGSFFDCNICLDLARDPVVTCCGHLFCWPCLYQWLHMHSDAKECPVCKGEVTVKNVTPIYGRGNNVSNPESEEDSSIKIPLRPHALRVESLRQTIHRTPLTFPVEEMLRRLGSRFDLTRDLDQPQESESAPERVGRFELLNRILTTQAMRREQIPVPPPEDIIDLTQSNMTIHEVGESRRLQSLLLRRPQSQRGPTITFSPTLNSAERLVESYFHSNPTGRNQEQEQEHPPLPVDDRDSFSSIAAVTNSESQTMDTAVEIDSMVSLSTSSSRRRNDVSRVSDIDSEDSRGPRRRRLN